MSATPSYAQIVQLLKKARASTETLDWDAAARFAQEAAQVLNDKNLPPAFDTDRALITEALSSIAAITERAQPLRQDIQTLLKAFGPAA